jgi:hypothetical protein
MSSRVRRIVKFVPVALVLMAAGSVLFNVSAVSKPSRAVSAATKANRADARLFNRGRQIFRFDTFGDQAFWGGALGLHKAIEGSANGGVGPGVSPKTALTVGLKVDSTKLPKAVKTAIAQGKVNLNDPKTTLALLQLNAVVGVKGFFNRGGKSLKSVGITCAVCHSTVDNSFAPGIGRRRDGVPNRDLNVGAIISLAPSLKPFTDLLGADAATVRKVLASWGPGRFDAELSLDGKAFRPDGKTAATLIPPAYGLSGVNLHTYTGWGSVPYWNAFVAILEMHGVGNFHDSRLNDAAKFPVAAKAGFANVTVAKDQVNSKLGALQAYELGLPIPAARRGSFNAAAARRGRAIFMGAGKCSSCHVPPTYSDPGENLHTPQEICIDSFQADRSPTGMYRTTPLRGLMAHTKGGFYHDGRFPTLASVVQHYNSCMNLHLTAGQQSDMVEFLKTLGTGSIPSSRPRHGARQSSAKFTG